MRLSRPPLRPKKRGLSFVLSKPEKLKREPIQNEEMIVYFDCSTAGASGDMILGALLDLGADERKIVDLADFVRQNLPGVRSIEISIKDSQSREIKGKRVEVRIDEELTFEEGEPPHPERESTVLETTIREALQHFGASKPASELAIKAFNNLVAAEADVHGLKEKVTLHEASSADTVIDIVGIALALEDLHVLDGARVCSSPIPLGGGDFDFSHGIMGAPAPATIRILAKSGLRVFPGPFGTGELTTPTGASVITALADPTCVNPIFVPRKIGYGIGQRDLGRRASFIRVILGDDDPLEEQVMQIETDVDDATGEVLGKTIDDLMKKGALDAYAVPTFRKKGRPGFLLRALSAPDKTRALASLMMRDSGTLGVRVWSVNRYIAKRETRIIEIRGKKLRVKFGWDSEGNVISVKPEFEDLKEAADELNLSPTLLSAEATALALKGYEEESGIGKA